MHRDRHFSAKPKLIPFQNACQGQDEWRFLFLFNYGIATLDTHFETCFWRLIGKNGWICSLLKGFTGIVSRDLAYLNSIETNRLKFVGGVWKGQRHNSRNLLPPSASPFHVAIQTDSFSALLLYWSRCHSLYKPG